jgi:hypothetical protein
MSANPDVLQSAELMGTPIDETAPKKAESVASAANEWDPEDFAHEQIRSLMRNVFFHGNGRSIKQVAFSALGRGTNVANICECVAQALAAETASDVVVVVREPKEKEIVAFPRYTASAAVRCGATRIGNGLWRACESESRKVGVEASLGRYWLSRLAELRGEFEFAVIEAPMAGTSSETALLGELADGIVLVLGANRTRKAVARKLKETLEVGRSRILGTVLSERTFPIPERLYRRL